MNLFFMFSCLFQHNECKNFFISIIIIIIPLPKIEVGTIGYNGQEKRKQKKVGKWKDSVGEVE